MIQPRTRASVTSWRDHSGAENTEAWRTFLRASHVLRLAVLLRVILFPLSCPSTTRPCGRWISRPAGLQAGPALQV